VPLGDSLDSAIGLNLSYNHNQFSSTVDIGLDEYFSFNLKGRSSLSLDMNRLTGNANLELLDTNGTPIQQSAHSGIQAESISQKLDAGKYYVRVSAEELANYNLTFTVKTNLQSDFLWQNQIDGSNQIWYVNGINKSSATYNVPSLNADWRIETTADFNGDGKIDWVWRNQTDGRNLVWYMDGINQIGSAEIAPFTDLNWHIAGAADFNQDGKTDLLWKNGTNSRTQIWFMDGANQTSTSYFFGNGDNWQVAGVADFNGDGNADLLWRNQVDGRNAILYLDKTLMVIYPRSFEALADTNWQIVGIGDFDNDGSLDLLWRNQLNGRNLIWYMDRGASYIDAIAKKSSVEIEPLADTNWQIAGIFQWFGEPEEDIPGSTKLTIASASRVTADLAGLNANTNIQFLDSNGVVVKSISNGSGTEGQISSILAPGTYYVVMTGDNNSSNYPLQLQQEALPFGLQSSSLQVTDRDLSKPGINVDAGDFFGFNFSVTNNSESSITSPFDVGLYITSDPRYLNDPSDSNHIRKIGSYRMDALGWGETKEVKWTAGDIAGANWTFDGYPYSAMLPGIADDIWKWGDGNYYMAAIVDPDQQLSVTKTKTLEEGEDINQISVSGASLIDLQGAAFDPYNQLSAIARGNSFSLQFKVKNTGPTPAGSFRVGFYLSPTLPITRNAIFLGGYLFAGGLPGFSALNPAYNLMLTKSGLKIPPYVQPGTYYLGMYVDSLGSFGEVPEFDESNNSSRGAGIDYKVVTVV